MTDHELLELAAKLVEALESPTGATQSPRQSRRKDRTMKHTCHWPGCATVVLPAMWGCKAHWYRLPKAIRDDIWANYRPGQETTKTPSAGYIAAAKRAQQWIQEQQ